MICRNCGRVVPNENANFCEYCGDNLRLYRNLDGNAEADNKTMADNETATYISANTSSDNGNIASGNAENDETNASDSKAASVINNNALNLDENDPAYISAEKWFGYMAIQYIPVIGGIIYFVMLIIWGNDETSPWYKKNWAKGSLVFIIVRIVLVILLSIYYVKIMNLL